MYLGCVIERAERLRRLIVGKDAFSPAGGHVASDSAWGYAQVAKVRVMYWKEIPVQVQAEDESGPISLPLDDRFQQGVDAVSMFDGNSDSDDYLMAWEWGPYTEVEGTAKEAAASVAERFNGGFPEDMVSRIRELHRSGNRDSKPGAVDHWIEQ